MEIFKTIEGYEKHEISNFGNVKSLIGNEKILNGWLDRGGYKQVRLSRTYQPLIHRLVAEHFLENWNPTLEVDHIDRDPSNNHVNNLRMATRQQNMFNSSSQKDSSSKYKGVSWHKGARKWMAQIQIDGKKKHLGFFDNEEDARDAYIERAREIHGDFYNPEN